MVVEAKPNPVASSTPSKTPFPPVASTNKFKTPVRGQVWSTTPSLLPTKPNRQLAHSPALQSPIQGPKIGTSFRKSAPIDLSDSDDSGSDAVVRKRIKKMTNCGVMLALLNLMVVNDPGEFLPPAYMYTGFAQLAHPDELPWDDRRGTKDIYVVTCGRRVGIFADWVLVQDLAKGVPDAYFRKCDNLDEAVARYTAAYSSSQVTRSWKLCLSGRESASKVTRYRYLGI
ncbi:hypothetical protein K435DRAFT_872276 [Dendrothele bispora CBS 962.96]|uniref:Ribonuclease H1 N-terminal domain-containing protein n=1 Tax=Dendrothele bispora (strain CBS 962.96) TaxID=1314807 RepID=A0A4S8L2F9_DENBC|nr:hypothetical protein K435DRAFT_872276 [Dendrothele bispora CBS 962.96]